MDKREFLKRIALGALVAPIVPALPLTVDEVTEPTQKLGFYGEPPLTVEIPQHLPLEYFLKMWRESGILLKDNTEYVRT